MVYDFHNQRALVYMFYMLNPFFSVTCPPKFVLIGEECYYYDESKTTFTEAQKICAARGAVLASPETTEEMKSLQNYFARLKLSEYICVQYTYLCS